MDDQLLSAVYHALFDDPAPTWRCVYGDNLIALIEFFRVGRQLSARQALRRPHWPLWLRRLKFPSYSQFNRRVKTDSVQQLITRLGQRFRRSIPAAHTKIIDGKPLLVGGFSKDPDAKRGKAPGGWARGYKIHALLDAASGALDAFTVTALNAGESTTARDLLDPLRLDGQTLLTDGNYDAGPLYECVAQRGGRLVAPRRKPGTGLGHHPQHPDRLRAITQLEGGAGNRTVTQGRRQHDRQRLRIEQAFGRMTTVSFGLWALPPSVRRLPRVQRWVNAKIALFHLYLTLHPPAPAPACHA